jgi:hypothetical protein
MERVNAVQEDLGYRPAPLVARPTIDPGAFDYLEQFPPRMTPAEGMQLWRKQLDDMKERAVDRETRRSDSAAQEQDQSAA